MITWITALYSEAKELITKLNLKKNNAETLYQLFENEEQRLIVTGTGMISAATAVSRHFALFPSKSDADIVINLGVAGYAFASSDIAPATNASSYDNISLADNTPIFGSTVSIGDAFLTSRLTEHTTGRTFYPDFLYRHPFALLPLVTVPTVCSNAEAFSEETLIDMESTAIYQALLPHISPNRMFFFKVISDIIGTTGNEPIHPEKLLAPHIDKLISFAEELHQNLKHTSFEKPALTEEEQTLSASINELLPMTEAMQRDYRRLLLYAKLANKPLTNLLQNFLIVLQETKIRGKKQAMPYLEQLRESIINEAGNAAEKNLSSAYKNSINYSSTDIVYTNNIFTNDVFIDNTSINTLIEHSKKQVFYQPFFSTIYAERDIWTEEWQNKLTKTPIFIRHYKDIFNRSHQDFAAQKKAPSLILAKKTGTLIYKGAPVCQNFGNEHFYYTSCMMNCIYHCDYCYLQGMYPSGHVVVFVNLEDYFAELETLLKEHPVYLCVSYDTDLLALEQTFSFVSKWLTFAAKHPDLTLEIRTKSGNPAIFESLANLFTGKEHLKKQSIFAWTVSPENLCSVTEHGAASLPLRLKALQAAKQSGFSVRLCFDPMIFHGGWKESYSTLVDAVFSTISADILYDVSIGVFRISAEYLKNMRKKRPDSSIVQYPYITEEGVSHYGKLSEEMVRYLQTLLLEYLPAEKIFLWNEN